ncbi:putative bifunctional diguanylate cyclase/phosphodiesterase [Azonexus sp.]|uniref:putative bifunctional diguanylate cyclase/phosphodiesterase n=1 Tax=Azonexus sp. TaxID=1872668 RepID=UPI0039E3C95D
MKPDFLWGWLAFVLPLAAFFLYWQEVLPLALAWGLSLGCVWVVWFVLQRRENALKERHCLMHQVFDHSGEAVMITDADNRILDVNPSFSVLTGYEKAEVLGKNPRLLSSGRTSREEYKALWSALREDGRWQGEIWDRRKDGAVYPKLLAISVLRDASGAVRYHIANFKDISSEKATQARLEYIAHHDMLTGLNNRFSLDDRLDHVLSMARREKREVALLFIDLDRFKVINETLGHAVGDELLIGVSRRLRELVRASDLVARLGGDEFVVVLAGLTPGHAAGQVAEKIVSALGAPYVLGEHSLYATPSIGVAVFPGDGKDRESLLKNAESAMYQAKADGRNNFRFFDAGMNSVALERLEIEHALRLALAADEFVLHFQPVIDVASGAVSSVEALVRWQHPTRGLLPPGVFIGVAEETGLIEVLGAWVMAQACRQLAEFRRLGLAQLKMAINISAAQMRSAELLDRAESLIERYGLDPSWLIFEITESVAMAQPEETIEILDKLRAMGIQVALDDFGTGYSSLAYLRLFALDKLKLDRSFVHEIGQGGDGEVICDATIGLGHALNLVLVAEGVETQAQFDYLAQRGCQLVQGYHFSRPLPADEVIRYIQERS